MMMPGNAYFGLYIALASLAICTNCNTLVIFSVARDVADIVFILDSSGSINDDDPGNWNRTLIFVSDIVKQFMRLGGDFRFGMVKFSDNAEVEFTLDQFRDENAIINKILTTVYFGGRRDISDGFQYARERVFTQPGDRSNAANIAILITDGVPNERIPDTQPESNLLKSISTIVAVGITDNVDEDLLRAVSTNAANYISTPDFMSLSGIVTELVGAAFPTLTPTPITPAPTPTPSKIVFNMFICCSY